jgi:acetyl esterase/lipase
VKAAIRFLRANAAQYAIDPERVGIWGDSSGGHLAALVGTSEGVQEFETPDNATQSDSVQAVVDFYGAHDLATMGNYPSRMDHNAPQSPGSLVLGGPVQENLELARLYDPATYVTPQGKLPPFLLVHGDVDSIVPFNQSVVFYQALRNAGQDVTFYKLAGADHGFRVWTPLILELVVEFFDEHLKHPEVNGSLVPSGHEMPST